MTSSSGNSTGSSQIQKSGSKENLQNVIMDQRKRKRMISNRESARRSRMRKQKHLDDQMTQLSQLRIENNQILTNMDITTQLYLNIEAENSVLRAQMAELTHRLQSLNEIINNLSSNNGFFDTNHQDAYDQINVDDFMNPWNLLSVNQPIMASANMFMY